jgi:hypothetical protein
MDTLKHPSASVNPDNQPSCNVGKTGVLLYIIVLVPKRLFKACTHNDNCSILWFIAKLPLKRLVEGFVKGFRLLVYKNHFCFHLYLVENALQHLYIKTYVYSKE